MKKTQNRYTYVRNCAFIHGMVTDKTDGHPAGRLKKEWRRIKDWITAVTEQYNVETSLNVRTSFLDFVRFE
jgi:hypothetical protein